MWESVPGRISGATAPAKASQEAAETNSSMTIIHPELPPAPPVQTPCVLQFKKAEEPADKREEK